MILNEVIDALKALKEAHGGDVDVTMWQYGGGLDDLCNVRPIFDPETRTVLMDATGAHDSGARR
jgi:hypothetical protein